jgi:opacity protein-like surface antigen
MKKWIIAVAGPGAAFVVGPALAADMPVKAPPAPAPVVTWTGGYLGTGIGVEWGSTRWTTTCFDASSDITNPNSPGSCSKPLDIAPVVDGSSPYTFKTTSARWTMYGGWNFQTGSAVVGLEVQFGYGAGNRRIAGIPGCIVTPDVPCIGHGEATQVRLDYDGNIRLRAGYLITPELLAYGTAGPAFQTLRTTVTCAPVSDVCTNGDFALSSSQHPTMFGWTAGGGLEWRYQQFIFRGEYRYSDYGNTNVSFFSPVGGGNAMGNLAESVGIHTRLHTTTQMAYFGASYLWGPLQQRGGGEEP